MMCRKPLMIMAIFGYLVLDVVFLINAFWFHQLRVGGRKYCNYSNVEDMIIEQLASAVLVV